MTETFTIAALQTGEYLVRGIRQGRTPVAVAAARVEAGEITSRFFSLCRPNDRSRKKTSVNIGPEVFSDVPAEFDGLMASAPYLEDVADRLRAFTGNRPLITYTAGLNAQDHRLGFSHDWDLNIYGCWWNKLRNEPFHNFMLEVQKFAGSLGLTSQARLLKLAELVGLPQPERISSLAEEADLLARIWMRRNDCQRALCAEIGRPSPDEFKAALSRVKLADLNLQRSSQIPLGAGYHEREIVKSLGAKWSSAQGYWYITIRDNPEDFAMWLSDDDLERLRELQRRIDDHLHPIDAGV